MSYPSMPLNVRQAMAEPGMRWRHFYWHVLRNPDFASENPVIGASLAKLGWKADRPMGSPGAGLDFLWMHRMAIDEVNGLLAKAKDTNWPSVVGWNTIPPGENDPDWPVPPIKNLGDDAAWNPNQMMAINDIRQARSNAAVNASLQDASVARTPPKNVSLDALGNFIEGRVHGWMHLRWSSTPPTDAYLAPTSSSDVSVANDWLADPFSSHVSSVFWKLHGWIDACIGTWETATGKKADFSSAWTPPDAAPPPLDKLPQPMAIAAARTAPPAWLRFRIPSTEERKSSRKTLGIGA